MNAFSDPLEGLSMRQPPTNLQAEQALLGGLMLKNAALSQVEPFLRPEHFADPVNGRVYAAILRRVRAGGIADAVTLRGELGATLDDCGGPAYLAQLLSSMVSTKFLAPYGRAVLDAHLRRELIEHGAALVDRAHGDGADLSTVMAEHARIIESITAQMVDGAPRGSVMLADAVQQALDHADAVAQGKARIGISTGMHRVDDMIGGLEPGTVTVCAGRPGAGKSSLGQQWALSAARAGVGVVEFSLEMSALALGRRALSVAAGVPLQRIRRGQHAEYAAALNRAQAEMRDLPLSIEDGGGLHVPDILAKAKLARSRHGLGLLVVDHLQIVKAEAGDVRNGSTAMLTAISHGMKAIAKELNIPVLLLSQLNRGVEGRDDKRPNLGDLRQSGAIEEDADTVCFVYREELHLSKAPPTQREAEHDEKYAARRTEWEKQKARVKGTAELIFEKVREGEPGSIPLKWDGATASFSEITEPDYYGASDHE